MPHEGYVMQTGGSARRSFIKNNGSDTYYVHGVPGHTHNASAMISVTADYSRQLDDALTMSGDWADEDVVLNVGDYTDSVEPDDATELYDRAVERGIGSITLIPENCQHTIKAGAQHLRGPDHRERQGPPQHAHLREQRVRLGGPDQRLEHRVSRGARDG